LDSFYIRGLGHNVGFLSALMAHPRFHAGRLTTGFIAEEFPDGFHGVDLPEEAKGDVVAVAAVVHQSYARRAVASAPRFKTAAPVANGKWVVKIGKEHQEVTVVETAMGHAVIDGRRSRELVSAWTIGDPLYRGRIDDRPIIAQIDRDGVGYRLTHAGAQLKIMVLSPRAAELAGHMLEKTPPDLSKFLLSPMPGLLVTVAVQEGQDVKAGQELAVVEAMKMENLLRAERDGKVAKLHAKPGDSLSVDQVIVEFA
ncbi:MAG TPA: biotin/lipoyl-containing protein, partial [Dongiaceae bacterium]|nr:biotin/lipoyl-containing protein [Dongiaceae bacterium]